MTTRRKTYKTDVISQTNMAATWETVVMGAAPIMAEWPKDVRLPRLRKDWRRHIYRLLNGVFEKLNFYTTKGTLRPIIS